jgi:hypothetical protein
MKKSLHNLAAILCLLTLLIPLFSALACIQAQQPMRASCDHCPKHAPASHPSPSCCSAQQPSSPAVATRMEQPAPAVADVLPIFVSLSSSPFTAPITPRIAPPPLRTPLPLRI